MKEYNQWELRFLSVLVPKERYFGILMYHYHFYIDRLLWQGDSPWIMGNENEIEWIETIDSTTTELTGVGDYLDAFIHAASAFKESNMQKSYNIMISMKNDEDESNKKRKHN